MTPSRRAARWSRAAPATLALLLLAAPGSPGRAADAAPAAAGGAGPAVVRVVTDADGSRLTVNGAPFFVVGMNWDYFPIGTNYSYAFWSQPDAVIEAALENEMSLMKRMGVNALRLYVGIPQRWVKHIHERYGIWTVLNHTVGRYGYELDGAWIGNVDYSSPRFREAVKAEIAALVEAYKGTPGLLMWMLGNENNYGLSWSSFEIEALPQGERDSARARHLYSLFGEIVRDVKARDPNHPVAIANGDLQYIDLIAEEVKGLDVMGTNSYRGLSWGDLFAVVKAKLGVPVLFTEFGADAWDARRGREDDLVQARYLLANWREIYEQSAGKGRVGNAIGGLQFQWSDGWWKYRQETNLDVQDTNASWPNGGYREDYVEGENNMNEEWWGLCAKGPPDARGLYELRPRTGYYALQQALRLPPYGPGTDLARIAAHFDAIVPAELAFHYKADQAVEKAAALEKVRLTDVRLSFETYSTGGNQNWRRPLVPNGGRGFDHMESFYATARVQPAANVSGSVELNVLGNVALNPIDEIFYENRGKPVEVFTVGPGTGDPVDRIQVETLQGIERVAVHAATASWDEALFRLDGFYRTGHYHWAHEGDAFGLYREANYGANIDVYNAAAPIGLELTGKAQLSGLRLAFGPELWWGANPTVMGLYRAQLGPVSVALLHQEDLAQAGFQSLSSVVPQRAGRKTTLAVEGRLLGLGYEVAGIRAGATRVGQIFFDDAARRDAVTETDTFGGKVKLTLERGGWHWYGQGAYMGLVADASPDPRVTYTGWTLKDSGSGNQVNFLTGLAVNLGLVQVAPNFLWQKPLVGPGQSIIPLPGGAPASRNIVNDPFSVRSNRETVGGELMLVLDPTPGTWMWQWDNDLREDAALAASLDFTFRHMPTTVDAGFFTSAEGQAFAFPRGVPAADVWEASARVVSAPRPDLRLVLHAFAGNPQANGLDPRQPHRFGGDVRVAWRTFVLQGHAKFNDWGPYDYYRDFNFTFPVQLMGDLSYTLGPGRWLWREQTRIGVRATSRWLNGYSGARYVPDPSDPDALGHEFEIRTYLVVTL